MKKAKKNKKQITRTAFLALFILVSAPLNKNVFPCADSIIWESFFLLGSSSNQKFLAGVYYIDFIFESDFIDEKNPNRLISPEGTKLSLNNLSLKTKKTTQTIVPLRFNFPYVKYKDPAKTHPFAVFLVVDTLKKQVIFQKGIKNIPDFDSLLEREKAWHGSMDIVMDGAKEMARLRKTYSKTMRQGLEIFYRNLFNKNPAIRNWLKKYNINSNIVRVRGQKKRTVRKLTEIISLQSHFQDEFGEKAWSLIANQNKIPLPIQIIAGGRPPHSHVMQFQKDPSSPSKGALQHIHFFLNSCHDGLMFEDIWLIH